MKDEKFKWSLMLMIAATCWTAAWMACRGIPDDEPGGLCISVALPRGASPAETKVIKDRGWGITGTIISPPGSTVYHLRVHITNPPETFYVLNYTPGETVTLMAQTGNNRVIQVEAYMIPGATVRNTLASDFYLTSSCQPGCTLNLSGEAVSVSINTALAPVTTAYNNNPVWAWTPTGDTQISNTPLCPSGPDFAANLVDLDWGLPMPTVPLDLYTPYLTIQNVPRGKHFGLEVWNRKSGIQEFLSFASGNTVSVQVGTTLYFEGYQPPTIELYPDRSLANVPAGTTVNVLTDPVGGWGLTEPAVRDGFSYNNKDTCGGVMTGATYTFTAVSPGCTIGVLTWDCDASQVTRQATVAVP